MTRPWSEDAEFRPVAALLASCDAAATNLETVFHDFESPATTALPALRSDPRLARDLAAAGFRLAARANNHAGDYGPAGMRATTRHVAAAGLAQAGVGESLAEARKAALFRGPRGAVALVSATSTFPVETRAGNPSGPIPARPGVSPLRFRATYRLPGEELERVRAAARALRLDPPPDGAFDFGGLRMDRGDSAGVATEPEASDVEAIAAEVRRARSAADRTIVSIHCHEQAGDRETPPDFLRAFARAMIDAGADAVFGHGPHVLRGIELYRGRPIFYSLGNFAFEYETVSALPADDYEGAGLAADAKPAPTPSDFFDRYDANGTRGHPADPEEWESAVAVLRWARGDLAEIELHPIALGFGLPRGRRGSPRPADPELSQKILERLSRLSARYGTRIEIRGGIGRVAVRPPS